MAFSIRIKRVYEKPLPSDGYRILIDRLWPRGLTKDRAAIDEWMKELAPSHDLRRWFNHEPQKWPAFQDRYRSELKADNCIRLLDAIRQKASSEDVTLLFAAKGETQNNAVVIQQVLRAD
jgi:uncharacterized protein YeaO (DUF488 family)